MNSALSSSSSSMRPPMTQPLVTTTRTRSTAWRNLQPKWNTKIAYHAQPNSVKKYACVTGGEFEMQNARRYYSPTSSSNREIEEEKRTQSPLFSLSLSPLSSCCHCSTLFRRIPQDEIWTYREEDENDEHPKRFFDLHVLNVFPQSSHQ